MSASAAWRLQVPRGAHGGADPAADDGEQADGHERPAVRWSALAHQSQSDNERAEQGDRAAQQLSQAW